MSRRVHSFVWGGIAFVAFLVFGIISSVKSSNSSNLFILLGVGIAAFAFVSCLILDNNFIGELVSEVFGWGFVRMPGLIFTLDLDGIIWLLTVKLLFWILGIILAIICGILAIVLGMVASVFVYPFALYNNLKHPENSFE